APAAGRKASHRLHPVQFHFAEERWTLWPPDHAHNKVFPRSQMQSDVSAVIDVSSGEGGCRGHTAEDFFGDSPRNRSHWRNEGSLTVWRNRGGHAFRDHAGGLGNADSRRLAQKWKFAAEFIKDRDEARGCGAISQLHFIRLAEGLDDQVDRSVLKSQPAII